jgi:hypothetical protein
MIRFDWRIQIAAAQHRKPVYEAAGRLPAAKAFFDHLPDLPDGGSPPVSRCFAVSPRNLQRTIAPSRQKSWSSASAAPKITVTDPLFSLFSAVFRDDVPSNESMPIANIIKINKSQ